MTTDTAAVAPTAKKKPEAKKPKGPGFLARLRAWPRSISAAGCAACLTGLFLMLLVAVAWIWFLLDPTHIPWRHSMTWTRIAIEIALVIIIPLVLYRAIKLWLEGEPSAFPDIDFAWQAGLEALAASGLSPASAPLFLVLGSASERQEKTLMRAAGIPLRFHDTPEGPAPLHWFAGPDGIYLFLSETCGTSALAALFEKRRAQGAADLLAEPGTHGGPGMAPRQAQASRQAAEPAAASQPASAAPAGGGAPAQRVGGTIMLDQFVAEMQAQTQAQEAATATAEPDEPETTFVAPAVSDQPAVLSQQETARQLARLEYVCHLLRKARLPLCPINGILMLVPFEFFQATARQTQQLARSIRTDLGCLQRELSIRCPVTALVVGMHQERGFRELVRRVGRERAAGQRFGRRFDVRMIPTAEPMTALCSQLSGVFEDWIHTLFREAEALARPGNLRLYGLLCRIRSTLSGVLCDVLVGGFAHDPQDKDLKEPVPFSGCYFAATGESEDQQAFVRGVFEKLVEEQEDVEWTRRAIASNQRYQAFAAVSLALAAGLGIALIALGIYRAAT